jgi:hypothetical protein
MTATDANPAFRILLIVSRPLDQPDLPHLGDQWSLINGLKAVNAHAYLKILRPPTIEQLRTEVLAGYQIVHSMVMATLGSAALTAACSTTNLQRNAIAVLHLWKD